MSPLLRAIKIKKEFSSPAPTLLFENVDLIVNPKESVAIVGRSGEGKTTLLHILGTLDDPTEGSLEIKGNQVNAFNRLKLRNASLGFVFQSFHLLEDYSLLENVLMPAKIARFATGRNSKAYNRAHELIERVGLMNRINHPTRLLSGGEKQRVAIARALCNDPDLILADEPSGNLDRSNSSAIHKLLIDLTKEGKKGLIIVTHDTELANSCDRQLLLTEKRLTENRPIL